MAVTACGGGERGPTSTSQTEAADTPDDESTTSVVRRAESASEAWWASGSKGTSSLVQPDGEPVEPTGRFVNEGRGVFAGALGQRGWLLASEDGSLNLTTAEGRSIRLSDSERLLELSGDIRFVSNGKNGWLVGGSEGWVQRIDRLGQLRQGEANHVFTKGGGGSSSQTGIEAVDAAYRDGEWLIVSADGRMVRLEENNITAAGQTFVINGQPAIEGVVAIGKKWYAFTANGYVDVQSGGSVDTPTSLGSDVEITEVAAENGTIALGTRDGRVAVAEPQNLSNVTWKDTLGGESVQMLVSSEAPEVSADYDEWLAVGAKGKARRLDAQGEPIGSVATVGRGESLRVARPLKKGWMVGVPSLSAIQRLERDLTPVGRARDQFDGATIRAVEPGGGRLLAVGDGGRYRVFKADGSPVDEVGTVQGASTLTAVAWNGDRFLAGGESGVLAHVSPDGSVSKTTTPFEGDPIAALSWSGRFWVVVGEDGDYQRLRSDGSAFGDPGSRDLTAVHDINFAGSAQSQGTDEKWLIVGAKDSKAAVATIPEEPGSSGSSGGSTKVLSFFNGPLYAVGSTGNEWLVGGTDGEVARISQQFEVIAFKGSKARDVLYGHTVRAIQYSGDKYLIGGNEGAVRQLRFDSRPTGLPAAVNGFETVHSLAWTVPLGFPPGPCIENFCYSGSCLESEGFCCESTCDGPCQSCIGSETGKADGLCRPIPAGDEPPARKPKDCRETPESSCGQTGVCDGEGSCRYWWKNDSGEPIQCQAPTCSNGTETPAGTCASADDDTCRVPDSQSCEPYKGCKSNGTGCKTSCSGAQDCVLGYVCRNGTCQKRNSGSPDTGTSGADAGSSGGGGNGGGGGSGCHTTPSEAPLPWGWALMGAIVVVGLRRSRKVGIRGE
jgi:hypothetical protein